MSSSFIPPMLAMMLLTLWVWVQALRNRVREIRRRGIPLQSLAKARDVAATFQNCEAMDNFNNLMQMPVLFYVLCLLLQQQGVDGFFFVAGAWLYVLMRMLHSLVQLTTNRVMYRFYAWAGSSVVLFGLWIGLGVRTAVA